MVAQGSAEGFQRTEKFAEWVRLGRGAACLTAPPRAAAVGTDRAAPGVRGSCREGQGGEAVQGRRQRAAAPSAARALGRRPSIPTRWCPTVPVQAPSSLEPPPASTVTPWGSLRLPEV